MDTQLALDTITGAAKDLFPLAVAFYALRRMSPERQPSARVKRLVSRLERALKED